MAEPVVIPDSLRDLLRQQDHPSSSQLKRLMWLVITLAFFVVVLGPDQIVTTLLVLVPVILFHELGHLLAMKLCGYTDVSVFFIPLVGAAATGRETHPSMTRRAIVALMGPIPGILLGFVLMIALDWTSHPLLSTGVQMLFFLNLFNLLPIQPLDGGRLLHDLVMSRSAFMAIPFTLVSPLLLGLVGLVLGSWILVGLGLLLIGAAIGEVKVILVARRLKSRGLPVDPGKAADLPDEQLSDLLQEARASFTGMQEKTLATMVGRIHARVTTPRAPVFASLALVMVTSFVVFLGLVGTGISFYLLSRADPTYRGKTVSEWVVLLDEEEAVAALEAVIQEEDSILVGSALYTIGAMGSDAAPAVPIVLKALSSEDWSIRSAAASALGEIGPAAGSAAPDLVAMLQDEAMDVRMSAASALGNLGHAAKEHLPAIKEAHGKEESWLVRDALRTTLQILESR